MVQPEISLGDELPALPENLLVARDRGEVLFIVGAGASYPAPSSLPDFEGLIIDIYTEINSAMVPSLKAVKEGGKWDEVSGDLDPYQRTQLKFFALKEYDTVLGMLERRIDGDPSKESTLRQAVQKILTRTIEPNPLHTALVRLGQRFGQTLIVTTNFDRLLEIAAKKARYSHKSYSLGQTPNPSRRAHFSGILHIHGTLSQGKDPGSDLILTDQDFGDAYLRRHTVTSFLYDAARIFHLVLVGYSANDSPVRYLLNAIAGDEYHFVDLKPRYAFVSRDPTDERIKIEWESRGITPIVYDNTNDHEALIRVLTKWAGIIPEERNIANINKKLREIAGLDPASELGNSEKFFLQYLIRRSTLNEQIEIAKILSSNGASPSWLTFMNQVLTDIEKG